MPLATKFIDNAKINIIKTEDLRYQEQILILGNLMIQVGLLNDISMLRKVSISPCYIPMPAAREESSVQRES